MAIDPGPTKSAFVEWDGSIQAMDILPNDQLLERIGADTSVVIEGVESFGMAVGRDVFETVFWSGRFAQAAGAFDRVFRKQVKLHLCQSMRAKDPNIRQALIDRFGPGKELAIGKKATPGPLYGVKSHIWSALAVAVTHWDKKTRTF